MPQVGTHFFQRGEFALRQKAGKHGLGGRNGRRFDIDADVDSLGDRNSIKLIGVSDARMKAGRVSHQGFSCLGLVQRGAPFETSPRQFMQSRFQRDARGRHAHLPFMLSVAGHVA